MQLTTAQQTTLKNAINAETDQEVVDALADGQNWIIARWLNEESTDIVWRTYTTSESIRDVIAWKKLTPEDPPADTQLYANQATIAAGKAAVLQTLLSSEELHSALNNVRSGVVDALSDLPTGVAGALQNAGSNTARNLMKRTATRAESIFLAGAGAQGSPEDLVVEGEITTREVRKAMNS